MKDPTKYYFPDRKIYVDRHIDDGHMTGDDSEMEWLGDPTCR